MVRYVVGRLVDAVPTIFLVLTLEQMLIGFVVSMRHPLGADRASLAEAAGEGPL